MTNTRLLTVDFTVACRPVFSKGDPSDAIRSSSGDPDQYIHVAKGVIVIPNTFLGILVTSRCWCAGSCQCGVWW